MTYQPIQLTADESVVHYCNVILVHLLIHEVGRVTHNSLTDIMKPFSISDPYQPFTCMNYILDLKPSE